MNPHPAVGGSAVPGMEGTAALPWGRCAYRFDGSRDRPMLVLINALGADSSMWDAAVPFLAGHFLVLRYDVRGRGEPSVPLVPWSIGDLGRDMCALLDALGIREKVHVCGQAMGALAGLWLGLHASSRIGSLVLGGAAASIGSRPFWDERIADVTAKGLEAMADAIVARWFTADFAGANPSVPQAMKSMLLRASPAAYAQACAAIRDADFHDELPDIELPVLVIGASHDVVCTPEKSRYVSSRIAGARYHELPAAHLSPVEAPQAFADAIVSFLSNGPCKSSS